ncbi:acetyl-CoA C-acetyltransferase [Novosphingobium sp. KCTC 2891]|uniref:acetyl-CoA C-acetyltransferase n=1 Tax=Novosphingobium sp. KCTC 2891 TaxID=2989730 RepID=UPI0022226863|nr:acetyl-CoA C-acetyltransferase [Novosphingobium sp. KCTC 2891]MCW1383625.1 acetyl-CoA C-acetyltransferase [Novosphingobium sp. KCTC 2891]
MAEAYIIDAVRTPRGIGKVGKGGLAHLHPQVLGATVLRAIAERNDLDTADVGDVVWGTAVQRGKQGFNLGRYSALFAGYATRASGVTLDRACGSSITSVALAASQIMSGFEDCAIGGGTDMMSLHTAVFQDEAAAGMVLGPAAGNPALVEMHPLSHQGVCADAIAAMEGITRADVDALALESQRRAKRAMDERRFDRSVVPVHNADGSVALAHDEFPRPETTAEGLAQLRASFGALADMPAQEDGTTYRQMIQRRHPGLEWDGIHHAGNSSGVVDGSAAVLLASAEYAARKGLKPRARIVTAVNVGDCPTLMLNAPVPAARRALERAGLSVSDIDVWEINEAFAVVSEKFQRDLGMDRAKVNVNGGAIALGHPIGATGALLIGTALDELERTGGRYGLITMCAASGMAPAIIIERI